MLILDHGQQEIIANILKCRNCLVIMPTGAGKSICYQIPALQFSGITIVVSPLISLMKDQVDTLNKKNISAIYINSTLSHNEYFQIQKNILSNKYKIIYISPERLEIRNFIEFLKNIQISLIVIDEAHCVSGWGHNFRKSYLNISKAILNLNSHPIVAAFTATATEYIKQDIIKILNLKDPYIFTSSFDRQNLSFNILSPSSKKNFIINYLNNHKKNSGIIYCLTRKEVDNIYYYLKSFCFNASRYHGGLSEKERNNNQNSFIIDKNPIMIATNAFGMGIDKPNIRYVIHNNMPKDLECYYQEAGRAGRDNLQSECFLLFSKKDIVLNNYLIKKNSNFSNPYTEYIRLNKMIEYCTTSKCLRKYILEYFGEQPKFTKCNNCSNCK